MPMLRLYSRFFLALSLFFPAYQNASNSPAPRDPQAITILNQVISAAGGSAAVNAVQDVTASGTVTFNWAGQQVVGSVTIKGRGIGQYRLEATLPSGLQTWAVSNGQAFMKDSTGTLDLASFHAPTFENLAFPLQIVVTALQDSTISLVYVGLETGNGGQVHHIRVIRPITRNADPTDVVGRAATADVLIDANTFQVTSLSSVAFMKERVGVTCPREIQYSNYQAANGVLVPFSITELIAGQQTFNIQLSQVSFNSKLTDSDFQP
jgi:hypothetical protein